MASFLNPLSLTKGEIREGEQVADFFRSLRGNENEAHNWFTRGSALVEI
jgi:hypothetical protein